MVWIVRIALFLLLASVPVRGQDVPAPAASEGEAPAKSVLPGALPEKPAPQGNFLTRPFYDKKIRLLAGINAGAAVWDDVSSRKVIDQGGYERNPLIRPFVHNSGTLAAESVAEVWLMAYLADRMKRSGHPILRKTWWVPQTLNITAKVSGGAYNTSLLVR